MSFEALFLGGLGCSEAEFLLNNFQCICEFFYSHKRMGEGRGTRTKIIIIIEMQFVIKKQLQTTIMMKTTWVAYGPLFTRR
jgi:hypothetical protein